MANARTEQQYVLIGDIMPQQNRPRPGMALDQSTWLYNPGFRYELPSVNMTKRDFIVRGGSPQPYPLQWTHKPSWADEANRWLGLNESTNKSELSKLLSCDPEKQPWCADFVGSILSKHGSPRPQSWLAKDFIGWGVPTGRVPGAIAVHRGHVDMLADENTFIGGNLGNAVRKNANINPGTKPYYGFRFPYGYPIPRSRPTVDEIHRSQFNLPEPHLTNMRLGVARTLADNLMQRLQ